MSQIFAQKQWRISSWLWVCYGNVLLNQGLVESCSPGRLFFSEQSGHCLQNGASRERTHCLVCGKTWWFRCFSLRTGCGLFKLNYGSISSRKSFPNLCLMCWILFLEEPGISRNICQWWTVQLKPCGMNGQDGEVILSWNSMFSLEAVHFRIINQDKDIHFG